MLIIDLASNRFLYYIFLLHKSPYLLQNFPFINPFSGIIL